MSDCIIVGGGLIGMLSARSLAGQGMRVTLLERNSATGRESSWAGGGILSPLYPWRYPEAVNTLALWSQARYGAFAQALLDETGIDPEYFTCGMQVCDADEIDNGLRWSQTHGVVCERLPQKAGLYFPQVANIRNPRYAQALRKSLEQNKVRIIEQCTVRDLIIEKAEIRGVQTDRGEYRASTVVVAGGAWSGQLLDTLGMDTAIKPIKGQMILYKAAPGVVPHIILCEGRYLIPRKDGHVLVGSTMEDVGFDKSLSEQVVRTLEAFAIRMVPGLEPYPVVRHWAGLRPGSVDGVPIIANYPGIKGLYVNAGHFRNGVVLALASAQMLADIVSGVETTFPRKSYGLTVRSQPGRNLY